jgi:GGDEF domain-containing protein
MGMTQRHEWYPPPAIGSWRMSARDDPITGFVAWPGFFARLPTLIAQHLHAERPVGLSIGKVQDLSGYVESMSAADSDSFGHLAGIELVTQLGVTARDWLHTDDVRDGCLATFGGGEIVLVAAARSEAGFVGHVGGLRAALVDALPRGVSFVATVLEPRSLSNHGDDDGWRDYCVQVIGRVERALLAQMSARRHHRPNLPIITISVR